jgi:hypothetical protein
MISYVPELDPIFRFVPDPTQQGQYKNDEFSVHVNKKAAAIL